jgi:hypothetical protein
MGPAQPPIQWVPVALSPDIKRPGRDAENSYLMPALRKILRKIYGPVKENELWRILRNDELEDN